MRREARKEREDRVKEESKMVGLVLLVVEDDDVGGVKREAGWKGETG